MHTANPQPVNEPIITQAWAVHEDGTQIMVADCDSWQLVAFQSSRSEPILVLMDQDIADVLSDTTTPWDINTRGFNFEHILTYGADYDGALFVPVVGVPVRLEYQINRTNGRGPRTIGKVQPITDQWSANYIP